MQEAEPKTVYLKDYQPPHYLIDETHLDIQIDECYVIVKSKLMVRRNPVYSSASLPFLLLDGCDLELLEVRFEDKVLEQDKYQLDKRYLIITRPLENFIVEVVTRFKPQDNTCLEGLYRSGNLYCTQCEAEGFRRITYYLDRPDILSRFTVRIEADKKVNPVLLSNGHLLEQSDLPGGRHFAIWYDPFPKPCYLFAMVAGVLVGPVDQFTTQSGRVVTLKILVESHNIDKCEFAMLALKRAMRWDEKVYGLEYDLDIFHIVAVDDFNMGAMENKSLNIFNSSCVLTRPEITEDSEFERIDSIIAHEYFHNWSGNRVTCRDWFQLSLKEGLTVFRDSQYTADIYSKTIGRIEEATLIRTAQFTEDAGPMAHPVRPESFIEINNFYTLTVYEKGSELIRMIYRLLGDERFRRGTDLYFSRYDGQAVTTDDFLAAMAEASGVDLKQFALWYRQAGTPCLEISDRYDEGFHEYRLMIRQSCPATPGQAHKEPFHIPLAIGLLDQNGCDLPLELVGSANALNNNENILHVTQAEQTFVFKNVPVRPLPSLLRHFSAPVKVNYPYTDDDLLRLMVEDSDEFNRWDASVRVAATIVLRCLNQESVTELQEKFCVALNKILLDRSLQPAVTAYMLRLPSLSYLLNLVDEMDVTRANNILESLHSEVAHVLEKSMTIRFRELAEGCREPFAPVPVQMSCRALKGVLLQYMARVPGGSGVALVQECFTRATHMTDQMNALKALMSGHSLIVAEGAVASFYHQWRQESLVVLNWFRVLASHPKLGTLAKVQQLCGHSDFDLKNPNKVRAVLGAFAGNLAQFHHPDGKSYAFIANQVMKLDRLNPQVAARLVIPLTQMNQFSKTIQNLMRQQLHNIANSGQLSSDLYEVVNKGLHF